MAIVRQSTGKRNQRLDSDFNAGAGANFDNGILEFRTGSQPASANDAPVGTVVASITLPADAFGAAASGAVAKAGTWQDPSADASGTVTWARLRTSGDGGGSSTTDRRIDFDVTATGGGGAIELQNTSVNSGQAVTITSLTVTDPAS